MGVPALPRDILGDLRNARAHGEWNPERRGGGGAVAFDQIEQLARGLGGRRAMVALLRHHPARERLEQRIDLEIRDALRDHWWIEQQIRACDLGTGAVERQLAAQHLVDDDTEREQIDPVIDRIGDRLLGRHVVGRPEDESVRGQSTFRVRAIAALAQDRDPEVDDPRHLVPVQVLLDDDVLGLEVAVDEARLVRVIQALEHLAGEVDDPCRRHRCL